MSPYKLFSSGEVLTASDLQTYSVDQSVMTFASSADRTTALPTPSQGMVSFLSDSGTVWKYYELYNASTNPGGATVAGWYPQGGDAIFFGTASRSAVTATDYTIGAASFLYTEVSDTLGWHSAVSNTDRITPNVAGLYRVTNNNNFGAGTTGYRRAVINVNGSLISASATLALYAPGVSATAVVSLNGTTDYITCTTYQDQGSSVTVTSRVSVEFIRPTSN